MNLNKTDLIGEMEDRDFIITRGDSRIAITIPKTKDTVKLCRKHRFIVGDPDSATKLSYQLTKPLKFGLIYNGEGIYKFVLHETVVTSDDNLELCIADYYKHFPKENLEQPEDEQPSNNGKKVWF